MSFLNRKLWRHWDEKIIQNLENCYMVCHRCFIGTSIYQCYDYYTHPGLYALTSAPWYLDIQIAGIFTAIIVAILISVIWFIKKKSK